MTRITKAAVDDNSRRHKHHAATNGTPIANPGFNQNASVHCQ